MSKECKVSLFCYIRQNTPDRMVGGGSTQLPDNCLILADKEVSFWVHIYSAKHIMQSRCPVSTDDLPGKITIFTSPPIRAPNNLIATTLNFFCLKSTDLNLNLVNPLYTIARGRGDGTYSVVLQNWVTDPRYC